ncbi:MAG: DUF502 domain-containing protein [Candidatus Eiseniibacteriota bacterium]
MLGSRRLRNYFIAGVLVIAPTAISVWLLFRAFTWVDKLLGGSIAEPVLYGYEVPGVGFVTVVLIILLVGFLTSGYLGSRILGIWERLLSTIPLMNRIYPAIKQIGSALLSEHRAVFREAVLIEYPRRGMYSLAFTTKPVPPAIQQHVDTPLMSVFLPTTPNPTSGVFLMLPRDELVKLDLTVEEAIKLIISGGMVPPEAAAAAGGANGAGALGAGLRVGGALTAPVTPGGDGETLATDAGRDTPDSEAADRSTGSPDDGDRTP